MALQQPFPNRETQTYNYLGFETALGAAFPPVLQRANSHPIEAAPLSVYDTRGGRSTGRVPKGQMSSSEPSTTGICPAICFALVFRGNVDRDGLYRQVANYNRCHTNLRHPGCLGKIDPDLRCRPG